MKPPRLLTLLAAALLCAASLQSSPAADGVVVIRQIELNVSIKQYEKVLMEHFDAKLQLEMVPMETGLTDEQLKEWLSRAQRRFQVS